MLREASLSSPVPAFHFESFKHPMASSKQGPMTLPFPPAAGVARAPSQPCAGENSELPKGKNTGLLLGF